MRKNLIRTAALGTALLVGSVGVASVLPSGIANAATPATSATAKHPGHHHLRREEFKVAANTIGVKPSELRADVKGGQSIADVATSKGVSVDTVVNAVVSDTTAKIDKAVANGKVTQERATKIEAKLPDLANKLVNAHVGSHTAVPAGN